jgi:hypothetical protein
MNVLDIFLYLYLFLGFIYAMYVLAMGGSPWYALPINVIGGPIIFMYHVIGAFFRKPRNHNL